MIVSGSAVPLDALVRNAIHRIVAAVGDTVQITVIAEREIRTLRATSCDVAGIDVTIPRGAHVRIDLPETHAQEHTWTLIATGKAASAQCKLQRGKSSYSDFPAGNWIISVFADGHEVLTRSVDLAPGASRTISVPSLLPDR